MSELYLPQPTQEELKLGYKSDYYLRLIPMKLDKKFKMTEEDLYGWLHYNYSSIYLNNKPLSYKQYKKLKS